MHGFTCECHIIINNRSLVLLQFFFSFNERTTMHHALRIGFYILINTLNLIYSSNVGKKKGNKKRQQHIKTQIELSNDSNGYNQRLNLHFIVEYYHALLFIR